MQSSTEGMLIAGYCLSLSFMSGVQAKGIFDKNEIAHLYDAAALSLAELSPALMSQEARESARDMLEFLAKKMGPESS